MLTLLAAVALAAEPVVHDGGGDALARAAAASGRAADAFTAVPYASLRERAATLVGGGAIEVCPSAPQATNAQVQWAVQRADKAVAYGDYGGAATELAAASRLVNCLGEPAELAHVTRLRMLVGVVRAAGGDRAGAVAAFRDARALGAEPAWDDAWPPDARAAFDDAAPGAPIPVRVHAPTATDVRIDGVALASGAAATVRPGTHLVLVRDPTPFAAAVTVDGPADLVVPAAFGPELSVAAEPASRPSLTALLAAAFGEGASVLVVTDAHVWAATAGRTDWIALETRAVATPPPTTPVAEPRGRSSPLPPALAGVGGAAALAGGALAWASFSAADAASERMRAAGSEAAFVEAEADYERAAARLRATRWIAAGGAVLGGAGLVWWFGDRVAVAPGAAGAAGLTVRVRR